MPGKVLSATPAPPWSQRVRPPVVAGNFVQRIGFWILCAYIVSAVLNEWAIRLLHIKAYVSVISLFAVPVVWLCSRLIFRGLKHPIGWWTTAFLIWLVIDIPFSVWHGGSFSLVTNSLARNYMLYFYITALVLSVNDLRQFMFVNAITSGLMVISCVAFGRYDMDGRYFLPGGVGIFGNSNYLAMALLLGVTQFVYIFSRKGWIGKIIAVPGIAFSLIYMTRTGSRGVVLAAIAYGIMLLSISRHRVRSFAIAIVLGAGALALTPSGAFHRLMLLTGDEPVRTSGEASAIESETSRIGLLKSSLRETLLHPLFGVGPGQFAVQQSEEAKDEGVPAAWLGTHNSYTQVSAECGLPAFVFYCAILFGSLGLSLRIWKRFRNRSDGEEVTALSIALLSGLLVYAVCSFFFHMAYEGSLPVYAGQAVALWMATNSRASGLMTAQRGAV